ncbi:MAG TPA: PqqD family peptide modification chaperone [Longimicrobiales bacterium]|nr:PqqD family peptide modification chaperone [Longimicrobiales bacterium]
MMSTTRAISLDDTVAAAQGQIAADVGGELVILNVATGEYYGLNAVGARIWELIGEPTPVADVLDELLREYTDVDRERCTADLLALLNDLHAASLVEMRAAHAIGH